MFKKLIQKLKENPRTIVFTEGTDARILEASSRLLAGTFLKPILVGNEAEVRAAAEEAGYNINGAEIIDPKNYDRMDEMVAQMVELRKGKMTEEQCREALSHGNYFGTMLVKMGVADCLLGGATYSTADTVRPALQLIKTKPGNKIVSSCFILVRPAATGDNEVLAMGDCAINIKPSEDDLVEIALETADCAKIFGIDPKVAFLSLLSLATQHSDPVKVRTLTKCVTLVQKQKKLLRIFLSMVSFSSTLLYLRVLLRQNARIQKLQDMLIHLSSRTSMPVTSVTKLLSVLVDSMLTVRSFLV